MLLDLSEDLKRVKRNEETNLPRDSPFDELRGRCSRLRQSSNRLRKK